MKQKTEVSELPAERMISQAISEKLPIETLERLFALREKMRDEAAKAAYVEALSQFQSQCPIIDKTRKVLSKDGSLRYLFAPMESIVKQIKKPVADAKLSYRWEVKSEATQITAICIVTHVMGHSETSEFTIPIDKEGYMTAPQKVASALTFAKRYSLLNALGISTGDEDTDATDVKQEKAPKSVKANIMMLLKQLGNVPKTKEDTEDVVRALTSLDLVEGNYDEIATRLQVLVDEKHENA